MLHRGMMVAAVAVGAIGLAGQAQAATYSFGDGSYIDAYDGDYGLKIETELHDLSGVSFDLDSWEMSNWFPLFTVWTNEQSLDHKDKKKKDFDIYLDLDCVDELVHLDGETYGDKYTQWEKTKKWNKWKQKYEWEWEEVTYEFGKIKLDEWTYVNAGHIQFYIKLTMDDGVFNHGQGGLLPGQYYGEVVYAKIKHVSGDVCCSMVPTPSAAGAGLALMTLGVLRRRRRTA